MKKYELNLIEIERIRAEKSLSGRDIAERMECSYQHFYRTIKGDRKSTTETILKLAKALDCDPRAIAPGFDESCVIQMNDAKYLQFGLAITRARIEQNLTCYDLSITTGIQRSRLSSYEDGCLIPPVDDALKIAGALGTTVEKLFSP